MRQVLGWCYLSLFLSFVMDLYLSYMTRELSELWRGTGVLLFSSTYYTGQWMESAGGSYSSHNSASLPDSLTETISAGGTSSHHPTNKHTSSHQQAPPFAAVNKESQGRNTVKAVCVCKHVQWIWSPRSMTYLTLFPLSPE